MQQKNRVVTRVRDLGVLVAQAPVPEVGPTRVRDLGVLVVQTPIPEVSALWGFSWGVALSPFPSPRPSQKGKGAPPLAMACEPGTPPQVCVINCMFIPPPGLYLISECVTPQSWSSQPSGQTPPLIGHFAHPSPQNPNKWPFSCVKNAHSVNRTEFFGRKIHTAHVACFASPTSHQTKGKQIPPATLEHVTDVFLEIFFPSPNLGRESLFVCFFPRPGTGLTHRLFPEDCRNSLEDNATSPHARLRDGEAYTPSPPLHAVKVANGLILRVEPGRDWNPGSRLRLLLHPNTGNSSHKMDPLPPLVKKPVDNINLIALKTGHRRAWAWCLPTTHPRCPAPNRMLHPLTYGVNKPIQAKNLFKPPIPLNARPGAMFLHGILTHLSSGWSTVPFWSFLRSHSSLLAFASSLSKSTQLTLNALPNWPSMYSWHVSLFFSSKGGQGNRATNLGKKPFEIKKLAVAEVTHLLFHDFLYFFRLAVS